MSAKNPDVKIRRDGTVLHRAEQVGKVLKSDTVAGKWEAFGPGGVALGWTYVRHEWVFGNGVPILFSTRERAANALLLASGVMTEGQGV